MRTKHEMEAYAQAIAEAHFYADVDDYTPWEPFENWPEEQLEDEVDALMAVIYNALLWVQDGEKT